MAERASRNFAFLQPFWGAVLSPSGYFGMDGQHRLEFIGSCQLLGLVFLCVSFIQSTDPNAYKWLTIQQAFGMVIVFISCQLYLVDSFTYAASALSATWVLRAAFGFSFPLFGDQMFAAMGFAGGNSLLAGLAIVLGIPFPIWLYYRGEQMRMRNPLNR